MNDHAPSERPESPLIDAVARQWFVRLRGEVSSETRADFEAWLRAAPGNATAYEVAEQHFAQAEILKGSALYGLRRDRKQNWLSHHKRWAAGVVAIAATLVIALFLHTPDKPGTPPTVLAQSATPLTARKGEIRTIRLADGSNVTLDTDSRIEVSINDRERHLRLTRGHVRLAIAADPRPFRIEAGAGTIATAEGSSASFDIGYDDDRSVRVAMISGRAEARPLLQTGNWTVPITSLGAGQGLGWPAQGFSPFPLRDRATRIDAAQWPTGWVSYHSVALEELVAQANRYADRPIILDGPDVGQMAISGRFHVSEPASLAGHLAEVFTLTRTDTPEAIHLRQK